MKNVFQKYHITSICKNHDNIFRKKAAIKPFLANVPILYSLKRPENLKVFWCFQGIKNGNIGQKWVKCELLI